MSLERSKFAGGDQAYLRDEQYAGSDRLARRAGLHALYSTSPIAWFDWVSAQVGLAADAKVLEVGCGAGWMWEQSTIEVPAGVTLTVTDLSGGMVDEAVARIGATGRVIAVTGQVADAQQLPFDTGQFDIVIANHMLYHLPSPARGVAELARVLAADGHVVVATNGRRHMQELWAIRGQVFRLDPVDHTVDVFGIETGFPVLRDHFGSVVWRAFRDSLRCTDPDDVLAYLCSTPPAEDATPAQRDTMKSAIADAFDAGDGVMTISKDTGCFVCRDPDR